MTVSWRRSADCGAGAVATESWRAVSPVPAVAPQFLQKRLSVGLLLPQAPHSHGRGAPQSPQNLSSLATLALQRGQTRSAKLAVIHASKSGYRRPTKSYAIHRSNPLTADSHIEQIVQNQITYACQFRDHSHSRSVELETTYYWRFCWWHRHANAANDARVAAKSISGQMPPIDSDVQNTNCTKSFEPRRQASC